MAVDDNLRLIGVHRAVNDCRLRQVEFDVIAIDVNAVRRRSREAGGAVGVCARHDQHGDAVEERTQIAHGEPLGDREHRFAAGRFVAVLEPLQPDDRSVEPHDVGRRAFANFRGTQNSAP